MMVGVVGVLKILFVNDNNKKGIKSFFPTARHEYSIIKLKQTKESIPPFHLLTLS